MSRVAVTDYTFDSLDIESGILEPLGCELVSSKPKPPNAVLAALVADADCVLTQFARIDAEIIGAMQRARAIVRYGIGVDNVDLDAARSQGIPVCNVPGFCIDEVADQTLAMILALTRNIVSNCTAVRSGAWKLAVPLASMQALRGLTVGLIGCGKIGREVVRRLVPFGCRVAVFDPVIPVDAIEALGARAMPLERLLAESDIVSLHCPSSSTTRRMINRDTISRMKRGVLFVNVARGDLVDTAALVEGLELGQILGAALDVCDPEPIPAGHPLLTSDRVVVAAHIASASVRAVRELRETAARLAAAAIRGEPLANIVNGVAGARIVP